MRLEITKDKDAQRNKIKYTRLASFLLSFFEGEGRGLRCCVARGDRDSHI